MNKKYIIIFSIIVAIYAVLFILSSIIKNGSSNKSIETPLIAMETRKCPQGDYLASSKWSIICVNGTTVIHGGDKIGSFKDLNRKNTFVLDGELLFIINGKEIILFRISEKDVQKLITHSLANDSITGSAAKYSSSSTISYWYSLEREKFSENDIGSEFVHFEIDLLNMHIVHKNTYSYKDTFKISGIRNHESNIFILAEEAHPFLVPQKKILLHHENSIKEFNVKCSESVEYVPSLSLPVFWRDKCGELPSGYFSIDSLEEEKQLKLKENTQIGLFLNINGTIVYFLSNNGVESYNKDSHEQKVLSQLSQDIPPSAIMHIVQKDSIIISEYITFTADILVSSDIIYRLLIKQL